MQEDVLVFQGAPQPLDKDVVQEPASPIHRDTHAGSAEPIGPGEGRVLRSLIGIHYLGRAELVDGLVQRSDTEVGRLRVRDAPGRTLRVCQSMTTTR